LQVNEPSDKYEQEADSMADRVMRMSIPSVGGSPFFKSVQADVQCKCQNCEEEEKLHRKESSGTETHGSNELDSYVGSLSSFGQPLPGSSRQFFEPRFGQDFSNVRVHTDSVAAKSAQSINSLAYTTGSNIVFNSGQYSPESDSGKRLMAHELTHVVQQAGSDKKIQKLGANPNCTNAEAIQIHQAIYDARAWINNALAKIDQSPMHARVLPSLSRNFGPTYGVESNLSLISGRIRTALRVLGTMQVSCDTPGTTHWCAAGRGGWSVPGSEAATLCTNPPSTLSFATYAIHTMLHESFHAAMDFMTVDNYATTAGYPGAGTDPLLNADSYTQFVQELS
jgi:hypothetical protein